MIGEVNLFAETEDEILKAAAGILQSRKARQSDLLRTETRRLYRLYVPKSLCTTHNLGSPKNLSEQEALLLYALQRNKYNVEGEAVGGRWNGTAFCQYNIREGAICLKAESRHDLLLGLWASISDQTGECIVLEEQHLQGSLVQQHIRTLWKELKQQEDATA